MSKRIGRRELLKSSAGATLAGTALARTTEGFVDKPVPLGGDYAVTWYEFTEHPDSDACWSLSVGPDGRIYGLASGSQFFVFDVSKGVVIHREDLSSYGDLPRHTPLIHGAHGPMYAAFTNAIVRIDPGTFRHKKLATPPVPITAGITLHRGRLYFASTSHLWSYGLGGE